MNILKTAGFWLILAAMAVPLAAQTPAKDLLKKAEAALEDGDTETAKELYLQVIDLDPEESDAYYKLGLLSENAEDALNWYKQYAELEPDDAWGWLAVGDASVKVGKPLEALEAYERAAKLAPDADDVKEGLEKGRLRAAWTVQPIGGTIGDSEGNRTWRYGIEGDVPLRGGFRLGGRIVASDIRGKPTPSSVQEFLFRIEGRPRFALRLELSAGLARFADQVGKKGLLGKSSPLITLEADLRVRWRDPDGGPALEARLQRVPYVSTPRLVINRAVMNDARVGVEWPVGFLRLRGAGRASWIETAGEASNRRLQADGALVLPINWRGEISVQYHRLGYGRDSLAGYFAPKSVETLEAGTYWELGDEGPVVVELDLGAGIQRLAKQHEDVGPWKLALRGYALFAADLLPGLQLRAETEAYSAPFASVGVVTAPNWKYLAISAGFLIRIQ
jgi:hypothetical protein